MVASLYKARPCLLAGRQGRSLAERVGPNKLWFCSTFISTTTSKARFCHCSPFLPCWLRTETNMQINTSVGPLKRSTCDYFSTDRILKPRNTLTFIAPEMVSAHLYTAFYIHRFIRFGSCELIKFFKNTRVVCLWF